MAIKHMFNPSLPLQMQFRIIFTLKRRDCHLNAPQIIISSWFAYLPSSNLKFKAWNCSLTTLRNNLRSTHSSPLMIKIATRIVLEVIINGQINILTQTLSHIFTLNNFLFHSCFTIFGFFPLIVSPLLHFTTQLLFMSS